MVFGEEPDRAELLDVVAEIKSRVQDQLGVVDFPVQQFILVGKQSVGKSRLIECLAGETFNFVSGSLGSRRPTCLEFRLVPGYTSSRWYMFDKKTSQWEELPVSVVMTRMAAAHESLGVYVSNEPVRVRLESERCCDMQVIDLPGFREFALDDTKQRLAEQIDALVMDFMADKRNVMLCVEEAGDAANLATLSKCRKVDPKFQRTILIRNKLDKYYRDLTPDNVNEWMRGFGDLPEKLDAFAITLPHWKDGSEPSKPFAQLRQEMNDMDIEELKTRGASESKLKMIGFTAFSNAMTARLEKMLVGAIDNILKELKILQATTDEKLTLATSQLENTSPHVLRGTVRQAGADFGDCLTHVMEGQLRVRANAMTLNEELEGFHEYHETLGSDFMLLPSEDFSCLEDYVDCLRNDIKVPSMDVEINGGAQFRRLMFEVETFCRFSEICVETKKKDVIQARGVSVNTMTWREVVVKLLNNEAHLPMRERVKYIGERIRWFFVQQKDVILEFMRGLKDSPDMHMYSRMYTVTADLLDNNEMVKQLIFAAYDKAVELQLGFFLDLFYNTLASTFSNPWVFLKRASVNLDQTDLDDVCLPSFEDTKTRIPTELNNRSGIDNILEQWIAEIPSEPTLIDEAVDKAQMLCLKTFTFIRAQISDQIDLFAESFFKLKMLRKLGDNMRSIELNASDMEAQAAKQAELREQIKSLVDSQEALEQCIGKLQQYAARRKELMRMES
eukprot:GEMP01025945.1.p1 GENE.GEMP01025945.1~~GEMP01025945.1.p1  ORF type:complete len:731 (-),score=154.45 GEMP01025945.1:147-2339(-)